MRSQTESVIATICAADETIKKQDMITALSILRGEKINAAPVDYDVPLTRKEAANLLRVSCATVTTWAKKGTIRRMAIKGRRKALGFSRRSILNLLNGNTDGEQ